MKKNMLRLFVALFCLLIAAPAVSHAADTVAPVKKEKTQGFKPKNKKHKKEAEKKEEKKEEKAAAAVAVKS